MVRPAACLLTLLLVAHPASAAPSLVGSWFGAGQPWDKGAMYLDHMLANGDFRAHHRFCFKGKNHDQLEEGTWVLNGASLTIKINIVNGQFNPRIDDYRLVSVDAGKESYIYIPLNFVYTAKRVDAKFQMPSCDAVS
jgi:hypothetical protein